MTKCLVTGGHGFVGRNVVEYLNENTDWDVIAPEGHELPSAGVCDYIINLASASSVEESVKAPIAFIKNNVDAVLGVLEYARLHKPKVFLHMSSVEVYNVTNPYAASKAAQEEIVNAYWKTYGVPAVILRPSNIIGPGQSDDKFVPRIVKQIKEGETVKLYTTEGKLGTRAYNPVANVASAIMYLLENREQTEPKDDTFPRHWDLSGEQLVDNLQMAQKIAGILKLPLEYELVEPEDVRPAYTRYLVSSGAELSSYGWTPPQTLDEGLAWIN